MLDARAASEFSVYKAKLKLLTLDLGDDGPSDFAFTTPGNMVGDAPGDMGRLMRLAGWIDLDSEITVR